MHINSDNPSNISLVSCDRILQELNIILNLDLEFLNMHYLSDLEVLKINKTYLNHDDFTDIITFDLRDEISNEAEIFISLERVKENAHLYQASEEEELARICIHGLLHLSGIGDKSVEEKQQMAALEKKYLSALFHVKNDEK